MKLKQSRQDFKSLLRFDQVPYEFREPFIHTGYRVPNCSLKTCVQSIFHFNNNETINFWTHFIPFLFLLNETIKLCLNFHYCNFFLPLFLYLSTTCFYLLMSSVAHAFNCMSPIARHVCFILDYLCISIYGMACAIAYKAYIIKVIDIQTNSFDKYVFLAMLMCSVSNTMSCASRFVVSIHKRGLLRITPFILQYIFISLPLIYKFTQSYKPESVDNLDVVLSFLSTNKSNQTSDQYNKHIEVHDDFDVMNKLDLLNYNGTLSYFKEIFVHFFDFKSESDFYYFLHIGAAIIACCLYCFHIPERLFPGRFDILGSSHQIFHIFAFTCSYAQFIGLKIDMRKLLIKRTLDQESLNPRENFLETSDVTLMMFCCLVLNIIIFIYYYLKAVYNNPWEKKAKERLLNSCNKCDLNHEKTN
jgi:predicted membrane channel-forming protein YqfA (hemolysin III family)